MVKNPTERFTNAELGQVPEGPLLQIRQWRRGSESDGLQPKIIAPVISLDAKRGDKVINKSGIPNDQEPQVAKTLKGKTEKPGGTTGAAVRSNNPNRFSGLRLIGSEIQRALRGGHLSGAEGQTGLTRRTTAQRNARAA